MTHMKWKIKAIRGRANVGEQLKKARQAKGLTLYKVSTVYCIPQTFLNAVEANKFDALPNTVYTKGMLKKYLRILGLSPEQYLALWEEAHAHWETLEQDPVTEKDIKRSQKPYSRWFITPSVLQKVFVAILAIGLIAYIGIRFNASIGPPSLVIVSPQDEMTTSQTSVVVSGKTEPEVAVMINQYQVTVNEDGSFEEVVTLQRGLNVLEIEAAKKNRPTQSTIRHILVIDPDSQ